MKKAAVGLEDFVMLGTLGKVLDFIEVKGCVRKSLQSEEARQWKNLCNEADREEVDH